MRRFLIEEIDPDAESARITGAEFEHLKKVLRLRAGDAVALFNGRGLEIEGTVEEVGRDGARIRLGRASTERGESPLCVALIAGLPKPGKAALVVQKATELGVSSLTFFHARRTVRPVEARKAQERLARWRRVAQEAAKQCERTRVPEILLAGALDDALAGSTETLNLVFCARGSAGGLRSALSSIAGRAVTALVGPEGGLTRQEDASATARGFLRVGLGPRILRAETAAIVAISLIEYELGDMGAGRPG